MPPKIVLCLLTTVFLTAVPTSDAQQAKKMARIGYLSAQSAPPPTLLAFKEELAKLGWVETKQVEFEYRYGGGEGRTGRSSKDASAHDSDAGSKAPL
jgi:hypothetical protein